MSWQHAVALDDVRTADPELRRLAREYMAESDLWTDPRIRGSLIYTAHRLVAIADGAVDRVQRDPDHADVVSAFAYAGALQLEHVRSTRRFAAGGDAPQLIPNRGGRE